MDNYTVYHIHSALSNPTAGTSADSITKYTDYLDKASELGMKAFAFSEHGSVLNWINKKSEIEKRGMKYIHANEIYLTKGIDQERDAFGEATGKLNLERDNYHYMLLAKNFEGVKELNALTSKSFNREDGHYYYNPRLTFEELKNTSDNILMTSACLASPLWRLQNQAYGEYGVKDIKAKHELEDLLNWMGNNKHRMFFEIQYHNHPQQIAFNQMLMRLSRELKIPLIAGTDTHALNYEHAKAREIFLKSKGAHYGDEDTFDLTFKSYSELVSMFERQDAIPRKLYLEAIENTNVMADMVEEFELDNSPKYPKMYDNPIEVFKQKIDEGIVKRGIHKFDDVKKEQYLNRIKEEFETYEKLDAVNYMLLQKHIIDWCHEQKIYQGYGRGSVNGSLIAYVLGITEMDSIKHKLNFFRFLNPDRISLADIDIDFPPTRRQEVIDYLSTLEGIDFAEIITFNTKALKGSIRLVGKGLDMPLDVIDEIAKSVETFNGKDRIDSKIINRYPELFRYVDLINGVVESIGSHPSGFVVSPIDLNTNVSTLYTKESKYRVTAVNMKELDGQNYVKLDILGLDNIELINDACEMAGIERLTPDNIDISDMNVWKSLRESTLGIFQFESNTAYNYIKKLLSDETIENIKNQVDDIDFIDLMSMANGAIRPSGDSYRHALSNGELKDNGHQALNKSLESTLGYLIYQEQIMKFLTDFCNHTGAESDTVRRGLSKKEGTEQFLPKIKEGFVSKMVSEYGDTKEHAEEILESFLQVIYDAQRYGFSINHSQPYSYIGYVGAWLRYYYPLEFLSVYLNLQDGDKEKTAEIVDYMKMKGIELKPISFGRSRAKYSIDRDENAIYKGLSSIKFLNEKIAEELYLLSKNNYSYWIDLLVDIEEQTSVNTRQMEILIRLDFFRQFGQKEVLLELYLVMSDKKKADFIKYPEFQDKLVLIPKNKKNKETKEVTVVYTEKTEKKPLKYDKKLSDKTKAQRLQNLMEYFETVLANPPIKIEIHEQIEFEKENLGYAISVWETSHPSLAIVIGTDLKYTPKVTLYKLKTGEEIVVKVEKKKFWNYDEQLLFVGDIISVTGVDEQFGWRKDGNKWMRNESVTELYLTKCKLIKGSKYRQFLDSSD